MGMFGLTQTMARHGPPSETQCSACQRWLREATARRHPGTEACKRRAAELELRERDWWPIALSWRGLFVALGVEHGVAPAYRKVDYRREQKGMETTHPDENRLYVVPWVHSLLTMTGITRRTREAWLTALHQDRELFNAFQACIRLETRSGGWRGVNRDGTMYDVAPTERFLGDAVRTRIVVTPGMRALMAAGLKRKR